MQASQSVAAGYFGGYSAKMQDVGHKELQRMEEGMHRRTHSAIQEPAHKCFHLYSKRLLKDLESKGIIRTTVESLNLSEHADESDVLSAECVRTFPTVAFPASLLLKREEVETLKVPGASVIAAVYHTKGARPRLYTEAPFDLMYGFRGNSHVVDLFSPFEMLMYWSMEQVRPPSRTAEDVTAELTAEGHLYLAQCKAAKEAPCLEPAKHYIALPAADRILLPDLDALGGLRHRWVWKKRSRPFVPVWNYAKIPKTNLSPEENSRLLSIYMRPWTLNPKDVTEQVPLLSQLQMCRTAAKEQTNSVAEKPGDSSSAHAESPTKRRRLTRKETPLQPTQPAYKKSYSASWQQYIDGNVVSELSRKFIVNLLAATAARVVEDPGDSSEDSDDYDCRHLDRHVGSLNLVQQTLDGIATRSMDEGAHGMGKHAQTIHLGKALWQSAPLNAEDRRSGARNPFLEAHFEP